MELNWSTFLLEIINFLVLVWILKRFLYRPVLSMLEQRRETIEQSLNEATDHHNQAEHLEQQYHQRLDDWALEKQQLMDGLQQQIQSERRQALEQLQAELASEREKTRVIEQRKQAENIALYQHKAHQQGARFAARLLSAVASEELESHLFELLLTTFDTLDKAKRDALLKACNNSLTEISVTSAYPLSEVQQRKLQHRLETLCQQSLKIEYVQDAELMAGLRILIGSSVLGVNLEDELSAFVELAREDR